MIVERRSSRIKASEVSVETQAEASFLPRQDYILMVSKAVGRLERLDDDQKAELIGELFLETNHRETYAKTFFLRDRIKFLDRALQRAREERDGGYTRSEPFMKIVEYEFAYHTMLFARYPDRAIEEVINI
ncbi:MAG: hypothetical protein UZ21_OP11001000977 [Microgenomates bacterium OLB22]|nr:MAG: hypothetical protein UZ21_OP11001000977 [Microgenomates bacterium OLB22]